MDDNIENVNISTMMDVQKHEESPPGGVHVENKESSYPNTDMEQVKYQKKEEESPASPNTNINHTHNHLDHPEVEGTRKFSKEALHFRMLQQDLAGTPNDDGGGDTNINDNPNNLLDKTTHHFIQPNIDHYSETILETEVEDDDDDDADDIREEMKTGMQLDHLPLGYETKDNELRNSGVVIGMELLLNNAMKVKNEAITRELPSTKSEMEEEDEDEDEEEAVEFCHAANEMKLEEKRERMQQVELELNDGGTKVDLPPNTEATEEKLVNNGMTRMKLQRDTEANKEELDNVAKGLEPLSHNGTEAELPNSVLVVGQSIATKSASSSFLLDTVDAEGDESGNEEEQAAFIKELEKFHRERCLEFKPPRFYGEPLNCLKLWRAVIRLGGYEQVTSCKLWRQVGESFKPPKTCTTVSWTFRCFYEKALLEYEKHKMRCGELPFNDASFAEPINVGNQVGHNQSLGSGRARRDAAARAMQGWHSQRLLGNGEVGDPIIKDKNSTSFPKREKQLKSIGLLKRKKPSPVERAIKVARLKALKPHLDEMVVDIGPPANWVKINVQRTKDCFEVYALVPGLLREEVRVQSDPAGRLVISGQPEHLDNPWGVTPFKKVVSLPSRIDPHQTSAVVTLHGKLFVRVPFEQ